MLSFDFSNLLLYLSIDDFLLLYLLLKFWSSKLYAKSSIISVGSISNRYCYNFSKTISPLGWLWSYPIFKFSTHSFPNRLNPINLVMMSFRTLMICSCGNPHCEDSWPKDNFVTFVLGTYLLSGEIFNSFSRNRNLPLSIKSREGTQTTSSLSRPTNLPSSGKSIVLFSSNT